MNTGDKLTLPSLAEFVTRLRKERKWLQKDIAKYSNNGIGTIRNIEQGQLQSLSSEVLDGLIRAFERTDATVALPPGVGPLSAEEKAHLRTLAGHAPDHNTHPISDQAAMALLTALGNHPAAYLAEWAVPKTEAGEPMANDAFRRLWPGWAEASTLLEWWFANPEARLRTPDWETEARILVGMFRRDAAAPENREYAARILADMEVYPDFRRLWNTGHVCLHRPHPRRRVWVPDEERELAVAEALLVWPQPQTNRHGLMVYIVE
ncbi:helix-turn-helix transcriptional regulator [Nocardia terpenica]|uniref:HTH cro/C1-type domain-containing protein n=1 Tax=Nocardia terpenica TaxID=455432 RepID=A0A6G9ZF29_9NOCA|nr:helix-turn-helix transcriptional regulator [Nocardia terpenica]QIS23593.1 hypothetical protein F6W96_40340 [Nocardia terpenica]